MKLFGVKHIIISVLTFVIVFAIVYIGNDAADKLERALYNAIAGVIGISIGLFVLYKAKDDKPYDDFD